MTNAKVGFLVVDNPALSLDPSSQHCSSRVQLLSMHMLALALCVFGRPADTAPINNRDACIYTCGGVCYWQTDIDAALAQGYSLYESGQTLGRKQPRHHRQAMTLTRLTRIGQIPPPIQRLRGLYLSHVRTVVRVPHPPDLQGLLRRLARG